MPLSSSEIKDLIRATNLDPISFAVERGWTGENAETLFDLDCLLQQLLSALNNAATPMKEKLDVLVVLANLARVPKTHPRFGRRGPPEVLGV